MGDTQEHGVPSVLDGRMLLQVRSQRARRLLERVDQSRSGLVLTGKGALKTAAMLRKTDGFTGVDVVDDEHYAQAAATEEEPFPGLPDAREQLFGDPFEDMLQQRVQACGVALTPTGYLYPGAFGALEAAAGRVAALHEPGVVFTVPIDVGWLRPELLGRLVAVLAEVPGAKAVVLGGQMDPLGAFAGAVAGLVELLRDVPGCGLLRTDLAAFGALAWGAAFSAFGADRGVRHTVPPSQPVVTSGNGPPSPSVLFPELMAYFLGGRLADKFAAEEAPVCDCAECEGEGIDRFPGMDMQTPAFRHNAAVLMQWLREMAEIPERHRTLWWQQRCREAVDRYDVWNARLEQPNAFTVRTQLESWARFPTPGPEQTATPAPMPPGS